MKIGIGVLIIMGLVIVYLPLALSWANDWTGCFSEEEEAYFHPSAQRH